MSPSLDFAWTGDNVYLWADSLSSFFYLFKIILDRIEAADLRIKPSKFKLNVQSADILNLELSLHLTPNPWMRKSHPVDLVKKTLFGGLIF